MNPNADYLGIVTLLRGLREQGLVSGSEAKKIAARLMVQLGADIIISLDFFAFRYSYCGCFMVLCVADRR